MSTRNSLKLSSGAGKMNTGAIQMVLVLHLLCRLATEGTKTLSGATKNALTRACMRARVQVGIIPRTIMAFLAEPNK